MKRIALSLMMAFAVTAVAQEAVVTNPTKVQFTASANHYEYWADGITPIVAKYFMEVYPINTTTIAYTHDFGKPVPDINNVILAPFTLKLTPGTTYQARIFAEGTGGRSGSELSNPFMVEATGAITPNPLTWPRIFRAP